MQDRPTSRELVDVVGTFIEQELLPTLTDPRLRFRALIAVNVLAVVSRELAQDDTSLRDEWRRLAGLLDSIPHDVPENSEALHTEVALLERELCARIRSGALDVRLYDVVLEHAQTSVIAKLRVTNPRYLEKFSAGSA